MTETRGNCALYLVLAIFASICYACIAAGALTKDQTLSGAQTIVSEELTFELGFFSKGRNVYVGIWYVGFQEKTIVWVANREAPISNTSRISSLHMSENGNLELVTDYGTVWSTNLRLSDSEQPEAVLLDTGNFVLRERLNPSSILWQSFDHPTDTWLPGAKFGFKIIGPYPERGFEPQRLISWENLDDPSPGMFSAVVDTERSGGQILLEWNKSNEYWNTGTWTGQVFGSVPEMSYVAKFSLNSTSSGAYFSYYQLAEDVLLRLVMDASGNLKQFAALKSNKTWTELFSQPRDPAGIHGFCGEFGVSRANPGPSRSSPSCTCLQGFSPFGDGRTGCRRRTPLQCENSTSPNGNKDGYLQISNLRLPSNPISIYSAQNSAACRSACWDDCSCIAYSYEGNSCRAWNGALLKLEEIADGDDGRQTLYVKVDSSDLQDASSENDKRLTIIIGVVVSIAVTAFGGIACLGIRKLKQRCTWNKDSGQDLQSFEFSSSSNLEDSHVNNESNARVSSKNIFDLPFFSYASVSAATDNFSLSNKLGEGGFGPVYKGKLLKGQEIAVKRLSRKSGQGLEEFRNETMLIAKLQHRNLVRLLGCCVDKDEKILIYEYMANKSLDFFLFEKSMHAEPNKKEIVLDWRSRTSIIEGIAQGLLYLHQYSRLRIIHRDLKASNILLDHEMNPKISDFGMARIFCGNSSEANTNRIVGTYGYMAPEYALGGLFSIKSDVFSFGVLVLEIVSGKKNTGFYYSETPNLLGQAWELWISDRAQDLMDPLLQGCQCAPPTLAAALRYINIGLLCVQENPNDRPTMFDVVLMLGSEHISLTSPKQPGFMAHKAVGTIKNSSKSSKIAASSFSINGLTVSSVEPR